MGLAWSGAHPRSPRGPRVRVRQDQQSLWGLPLCAGARGEQDPCEPCSAARGGAFRSVAAQPSEACKAEGGAGGYLQEAHLL